MVGCSASTIACADTSLVGTHQDRAVQRMGVLAVGPRQFREPDGPTPSSVRSWNPHPLEGARCLTDLREHASAVAPGDPELVAWRGGICRRPTVRVHVNKVSGVPETLGGRL
jgi:hypothetical protein